MRLHPDEVVASGWRVETLLDVVQLLHDASPGVNGRPRVVAIDGRGGAGKSTLVERMRRLVPDSAVVHTDDVAWHQAYFDWGHILAEHVLGPVHRGEAVEFRPRPWVERGRTGAISVPAGTGVVWLEGTGVLRQELGRWIDASIWVQGDLDQQERRLVSRDGDSTAQQQHVADWLAEELPFLRRERPWENATLVADGTTQLRHDPDSELVVAPPVGHTPDAAGRVRSASVWWRAALGRMPIRRYCARSGPPAHPLSPPPDGRLRRAHAAAPDGIHASLRRAERALLAARVRRERH